MNCGVGCRCGLDLALLHQLPAAAAPIHPQAWENSCAKSVAIKKKKKKKKKSWLVLFHISSVSFLKPAKAVWLFQNAIGSALTYRKKLGRKVSPYGVLASGNMVYFSDHPELVIFFRAL